MPNFKLDTKEKFHTITLETNLDAAITAGELRHILEAPLEKQTRNVILNLQGVQAINTQNAALLAETASRYMEANASFVVCCVSPQVRKVLDELEQADLLNITPTESEAWDIVQMEEIERELLSDED